MTDTDLVQSLLPMSRKDLEKATGLNEKQIKAAILCLRRKGIRVRYADGKFSVDHHKPAPRVEIGRGYRWM